MINATKRILITGGAGFIGSNFIRHLYNKYPLYELLNLDLLTYAGNLDNLSYIKAVESKKNESEKRYQFTKGDICDLFGVGDIFEKFSPDIVINFAAESHVDRSIFDSRYFFRTNLIGLHNLVDLVIKYKIPRFIQISTDEVYGDVLKGESDEMSHFRPSNPYAASKAAADLLVQSYIRTHKLPAIILRGSNTFGPYQYPEKLIPLSITNVIEKRKIPVHGTGLQERRWLHVEDFCKAIDIAMHNSAEFSIYNVAGMQMTNADIIKAVCKALHVDYGNATIFINDRPGSDMRYAPDPTKIREELGWKVEHEASVSIPVVVQWYLENRDWWKKIKRKKEYTIRYNKQYKSEY